MSAEKRLAVVIPAYKTDFFQAALASLAAQTDQRFRVYVGDDASPDNIRQVCEQFSDRLDLVYTRFEQNLGRRSLVQHWHRCVQLAVEPWVWLFSDDDVMEPQCVEAFYRTLALTDENYDLYRFNTLIIDADEKIFWISPRHPAVESGFQFVCHKLRVERESFAQEYIFSRQAFDHYGGFVEFPLAWCSDDATWVTFAADKGICTISGPRVRWRYSGANISTPATTYHDQKIEAYIQYIRWLNHRFLPFQAGPAAEAGMSWPQLTQSWFYHQLAELRVQLSLQDCLRLARRLRGLWPNSFLNNWLHLLGFAAKLWLKNSAGYRWLRQQYDRFVGMTRRLRGRLKLRTYQVEWLGASLPELHTGQREVITVKLRNTGTWSWHSRSNRVFLAYHWLNKQDYLHWDGLRSPIPGRVEPGEVVEAEILVEAPPASGLYTLELDLVQESVAWFSALGAPTLRVIATVTGPPVADSLPLPSAVAERS